MSSILFRSRVKGILLLHEVNYLAERRGLPASTVVARVEPDNN